MDDEETISTSGTRGITVAILLIIGVIILVVIGVAALFARFAKPTGQPLNQANFQSPQLGQNCLTSSGQFCDISLQLICDNGYYGGYQPTTGGGQGSLVKGTCKIQLNGPCTVGNDADCAHNPYVVQLLPGASGTTTITAATSNLTYPLTCDTTSQVCKVPAGAPCLQNPVQGFAPCVSGYSCTPSSPGMSVTGFACTANT
jgi:hypothetical protein